MSGGASARTGVRSGRVAVRRGQIFSAAIGMKHISYARPSWNNSNVRQMMVRRSAEGQSILSAIWA